jgi:hypothetical protein
MFESNRAYRTDRNIDSGFNTGSRDEGKSVSEFHSVRGIIAFCVFVFVIVCFRS